MAQPKDHLSDLDRHVQLLESKVNQLRASLTHWQQWYLEYSSLKEEVEQLPDPAPIEDLRRIRRDFDGKVLTQKELNEIMGKNDFRDTGKIMGLLSHRIDYVEGNLEKLGRLLEAEENRLAAAIVIANPDVPEDEETGLPITDIIEQLDDDDNVIDYRLQSGSDASSKILEALQKAGVKEIPETEEDTKKAREEIETAVKKEKEAVAAAAAATVAEKATPKGKLTPKAVERNPESKSAVTNGESPVAKKTVSFAEDTKPGHPEGEKSVKSFAQQQLEQVMKIAQESQSMDMSKAIIPENESEEDARLRREMLEYSMSEIGPVVAELTLEEGEFTDDDDWDMDEDEDEEDDDEDEMGRSKQSVLSSDYIQRMQELEKKLGVKSAFSAPVEPARTVPDEGMGRISVVKESAPKADKPAKVPKEKKEKKSVSFATELDIAPAITTTRPEPPVALKAPTAPKVNPVADIVEKVTDMTMEDEPEEPLKRVSRFKKERATSVLPPGPHQLPPTFIHSPNAPPPEPTPPEDSTMAPTVVERATPATAIEPDDMDDAMLYQAAAVEYTRMRNQLIQKQGGFIEDPPLNEEGLIANNDGPKKVSRFKAARLTKLQQ